MVAQHEPEMITATEAHERMAQGLMVVEEQQQQGQEQQQETAGEQQTVGSGRLNARPRKPRERRGDAVRVVQHERRPRTRVPRDESRQEKFSRLATIRARRAIRAIYQLQNLAGPAYKFNDDQAEQVDGAIEGALTEMRAAYRRRLHGGRRRIDEETASFRV